MSGVATKSIAKTRTGKLGCLEGGHRVRRELMQTLGRSVAPVDFTSSSVLLSKPQRSGNRVPLDILQRSGYRVPLEEISHLPALGSV